LTYRKLFPNKYKFDRIFCQVWDMHKDW
jgi:hypothetical protein